MMTADPREEFFTTSLEERARFAWVAARALWAADDLETIERARASLDCLARHAPEPSLRRLAAHTVAAFHISPERRHKPFADGIERAVEQFGILGAVVLSLGIWGAAAAACFA